jgi:hypothetical protein
MMSDTNESGAGVRSTPGVHRVQYDWSSTSPSVAVIEAVADVAGCEQTELDPLYDSVDPDALDTIIEGDRQTVLDGMTTVTFTLAGYEVTVYADGEVAVRTIG